jgi:hypothetical protein
MDEEIFDKVKEYYLEKRSREKAIFFRKRKKKQEKEDLFSVLDMEDS